MKNLEAKIVEMLKQGTPLRAIDIAKRLGVERREVNHYLYSSLKKSVVQDSNYRWLLKTNSTKEHKYTHSKEQVKQDMKSTNTFEYSRSNKRVNPYNILTEAISGASPQEKIKILENAFAQEKFQKLEDEEINALQTILEESRRELELANAAYTQGKLSVHRNNIFVLIAISIAIAAGTFFVTNQFQPNTNRQPNPTIQNN